MENPNQIAYQKLLKRINEAVKDVNVFIELIELAHDVRILSYEQGVSDIKQVYGITPTYHVTSVAHREDNATIVEPTKNAA